MLFNTSTFEFIFFLFLIMFRSLFFVDYIKKVACFDKASKIKNIIGVITFILLNCLSYVFLSSVDPRMPVVLFAVSCLIYCMIFNLNDVADSFILTFVFYSAMWTINYSCNFLKNNLGLSGIIWDYITAAINLTVMYLVITKLITRFMHFEKRALYSDFEYVILIFFSLIGFLSLVFYQSTFSKVTTVICDVVIILFSYELEIVRKNEEQNELLERNLLKENISKKTESFEESEESERTEAEIRQINYDLYRYFNYLLSCKNIKKIENYVNEFKGKVNIVGKFYDTGNLFFDVILEKKYVDAKKAGIRLEVIGGFDDNELGIEPADASEILVNVLNNALEGAMKAQNIYKTIVTHFHQRPNEDTEEMEFYLKVQNTADTENLKLSPDGLIETSKEDKVLHGIGLKSVRQIVQSYGGTMNIDIKPGNFIVEIHIPISKKK